MILHKAVSMLIGTGLGLAIWNGFFWVAHWNAVRWGKEFSPIVIPLIGPVASLTALALGYRPMWQPLAFALCDVGNVVLVRLAIEGWMTSRWTRIALLQGREDIREVRLSLHRKGHFVLNCKWNRPRGEEGIVESGEMGTFVSNRDSFVLHVTSNRVIELQRERGGYRILDPDGDLNGWTLTKNTKA